MIDKHFYINKDNTFIKTHNVCEIFEDKTISKWCDSLFDENDPPLVFLRILLEHINSLKLWEIYIQRGYDVSYSYDFLCESISKKLIEKDRDKYAVEMNNLINLELQGAIG